MPPFAELVKSYPEVFKGWKPVRVDKPRKYDWYLSELGTEILRANADLTYIRIIVEKDVATHCEKDVATHCEKDVATHCKKDVATHCKNNVYVEPPEGFECTGEFRVPKVGEWAYMYGENPRRVNDELEVVNTKCKYVILRKLWKPLPWMKSGHWICRNPGASVALYSVEKPEQVGFFYTVHDAVPLFLGVFPDFVNPVNVLGAYLFQIA